MKGNIIQDKYAEVEGKHGQINLAIAKEVL